ncbi:unnamed protein product [Rotaria magnacalcarata]|uniref:Apple domain-containing protein n=1 Tax=Rotaria magnacalcarata TaxID=392030 RepID=A0A820S4E0_9BILA|nr:unnamed protein product [Rotaria magnacalcarata]CAF4452457.1 unnamed protein product [Rotaria magnacalcarata]
MSSPAHAIYSSTLGLSLQGHEFQPHYGVQLIFNETAESLILCGTVCNQNQPCRIFDYDSSSHRCRLFEADLTNGAIIALRWVLKCLLLAVWYFQHHYMHRCTINRVQLVKKIDIRLVHRLQTRVNVQGIVIGMGACVN